MGSNSSKTVSNSPGLVNTVKYLLSGSRSNGGDKVRTYPKRSSINIYSQRSKQNAENQNSFPSSMDEGNPISYNNMKKKEDFIATLSSSSSSHETKRNFNTSQAILESDIKDVSLQERLQNLGPVKRQDVLTNNTFIIPSLSQNDFHLPASKIFSSVPSQVVVNPGVSKLKIATSSQQQQQQQQLSAAFTSTVIDPASNTVSQTVSVPKTNNYAVALLLARNLFAKEAEAEFATLGKRGGKKRRYLDLDTVRQILVLRDTNEGLGNEEIEQRLNLKDGMVKLLGKKGVVSITE